MHEMQVRNIRLESLRESCRLIADVRFDIHWVWGDDPFPLSYEFPLEYADYASAENGDPCLELGTSDFDIAIADALRERIAAFHRDPTD